jgi:hypothetical protein
MLESDEAMKKSPKSPKKRHIKTKQQFVAMRREFVDSLDSCYYKHSEIVEILEKGKAKESDINGKYHKMLGGVKDVYAIVNKDLKIVRKARKGLLYTNEGEKTRQEYLTTQIELLKKSIQIKDYDTASAIADKISKARGIDIIHTIKADVNLTLPELLEQLTKK